MIDCSINGYSLSSMGVILTHSEIGNAEPNLKYVEVLGRSGKLDITDFLGVTYKNRTIKMNCVVISNVVATRNLLESRFNGKKVEIVFTNEPTKKWLGRAKIGTFIADGSVYKFDIVADVQPRAENV